MEEKMFQEIPRNCRYAYVRVSSKSQEENSSLKSQKQELLRHGVPEKNIRLEIGSSADPIRERPVFYNLIENKLKENDLLLVTKIDRVTGKGRTTIYKVLKNELGYVSNRLIKKEKYE